MFSKKFEISKISKIPHRQRALIWEMLEALHGEFEVGICCLMPIGVSIIPSVARTFFARSEFDGCIQKNLPKRS